MDFLVILKLLYIKYHLFLNIFECNIVAKMQKGTQVSKRHSFRKGYLKMYRQIKRLEKQNAELIAENDELGLY